MSYMTRHKMTGFSLVELMIALMLGALVIGAAISLFSTNQRAFQMQNSVTDIQQQGRFVMDYLVADVLRMGYPGVNQPAPPGELGLVNAMLNINGGNYPGSADGGAGNDTLTISFYGTVDCEGDVAALETFIVNTYFVDNNQDFQCRGSVDNATNGIALIGGVESFQVLAGIDPVPGDGQLVAGRYQNLPAGGANVASLRLGFLISSQVLGVNPLFQQPVNYMVLDQQLVGGVGVLNNGNVRRLFTTTINIRNFDSGAI